MSRNIFVLVKMFSVFIMATAAASCSESSADGKDVVRFMVLEGCKEVAINYFKNLDPVARIDYEYTEFDVRFESHPDVAGYMTISSDLERRHGIEKYAASIRSKCYPNAKKTISRSDSDYPEEVFRFIEQGELTGVDHHYVNVKDDEVVIMWRSMNQ